jgi:hypothetical protein
MRCCTRSAERATMNTLLRVAERLLPLAAAGLIAASAAGCAAEPPRAKAIDHYAGSYIYHHPTDEVTAAVQRLLEDRGYEVMPIMQGEALRTEWKEVIGTEEVATVYERYFVLVQRLTGEHTRVAAMKLQYSTVGMESYHPTAPFHSDAEGRSVNTVTYEKGWRPLQMGKPIAKRALDLEWALIRRLDPDRARQIEATVDYRLTHAPSGSPRPDSSL